MISTHKPYWIDADWPAPNTILAGVTTRSGGYSQGIYSSFNLAQHVGDEATTVERNRLYLQQYLGLPSSPYWLNQTHSTQVLRLDHNPTSRNADASITQQSNIACVVLTADCLPILICNQAGTEIAAIHAGWRGLAQGIIENTIRALSSEPDELLIWLGPAISQAAFEIDEEVRQAFVTSNAKASYAFENSTLHKYHADLYLLARQRLMQLGIQLIYGGNFCTYRQNDLFYSYRRQTRTGRMASLIMLRKNQVKALSF